MIPTLYSCSFQTFKDRVCDKDYVSCEPNVVPSKLQILHKEPVTQEITIVSAYFGIELFYKRNQGVKHRYYYLHLIQTYSAIVNPMVLFTDDIQVAEEFRNIRSHLPSTKTHIVMMDRGDMWAFKIYHSVNKTQHVRAYSTEMHPSRVGAIYVCTTHAKYEVMHIAARMNYFNTKYVAWQDASIFKHSRFPIFQFTYKVCLPEGFRDEAILYGQVEPFHNGSQPNPDVGIWVRAGAFIGERNLMVKHCEDYKYHVMKYLTRGKPINWSLTEQVIVHAMAVDQEDPVHAPIIGRRFRPLFICMKRSDGVMEM